jgi:hypothetical protein
MLDYRETSNNYNCQILIGLPNNTEDGMGGICSTNKARNAYQVLVRKSEGCRPFGKQRQR